MTMKTQEPNKLIADFMGVGKHYEAQSSNRYNQYHISWDWLMPVVERIEEAEDLMSQEKFIRIEYDVCIIPHHKGEITEYGMTKIEATYKAVVQFIEYYNNLNK